MHFVRKFILQENLPFNHDLLCGKYMMKVNHLPKLLTKSIDIFSTHLGPFHQNSTEDQALISAFIQNYYGSDLILLQPKVSNSHLPFLHAEADALIREPTNTLALVFVRVIKDEEFDDYENHLERIVVEAKETLDVFELFSATIIAVRGSESLLLSSDICWQRTVKRKRFIAKMKYCIIDGYLAYLITFFRWVYNYEMQKKCRENVRQLLCTRAEKRIPKRRAYTIEEVHYFYGAYHNELSMECLKPLGENLPHKLGL